MANEALARILPGEKALARLVLAVAFASVAIPLCLVKFVPFVDYPDHLAQIATIANISDPRFAPYYTLALGKSQYFSFYLPAALLSKALGTEIATRIVLVATLAGFPLAVAAYLSAHKRNVLPAAAAAFVAFNIQTFWGFLNFILGVTIGILGLAAHARLVEKPSAKRAAVFGFAAVACFYAHPYTYVWLVLACFLQTLCMLPAAGWKRALASAWRAVVAGIPSVVALFVWLHESDVLEHGEAGSRVDVGSSVANSQATFTPPADMVTHFMDHSFGVYMDGSSRTLAMLFFVAAGGMMLLRLASFRPWRKEAPGVAGDRSSAPEAVLLLSLVAFVYGPDSYKLVGGINTRFIVISFALLPVTAPLVMSLRVQRVVGVCLAGLLAWHTAIHLDHFRRADAEMGDLSDALHETAPGRRVLGLIFEPRSELVPLALYLHAHQYYQSRVGGMAAWGFVELAHSPVSYRLGSAPAPFPPRFEWEPEQFDWERWGESFDYFLVRTAQGRKAPWALRSELSGRTTELYDGSRWKLYERIPVLKRPPRPAVDPGPDALVTRDEALGAGVEAKDGDVVSVHYAGTLMDGTPFWNTKEHGPPYTFKLGDKDAMRGLSVGVAGMRIGGRRELIVPHDQAYGRGGLEPTVPPGAGVIMDVELVNLRRP